MDSARLSIVFFLIFTGKAGKRMKKRWIAHPPQKARAGQTTGSQSEDKVSGKRYFVFLCRLRGGKIEAGDGEC
jgi:hypothetical protein